MDITVKYPALAEAIHLMQMDNGYHDPAGIVQALTRMEAEATAPRSNREVTIAQVAEAEAWCAAQSPEDLDTACSGEDITAEGGMGMVMSGLDGDVVIVPEGVSAVLNYLFDNM